MKYWNPQTEIVKDHGDVVRANQMNGTWVRVSEAVFGSIEYLRTRTGDKKMDGVDEEATSKVRGLELFDKGIQSRRELYVTA